MKKDFKVLVPMDFTKAAICALSHASLIATHLNGEIFVLNIIDNKKEIDKAREKLDKTISKFQKDYDCKYHPVIRIGTIFEDIGDVAVEIDSRMIIMGTHGIRGMQIITGSHAMRVISSSEIPFIIVQKKFKNAGINNIVLPVDTSQSTKDKLAITANMAKSFNAKVNIFVQKETEEFLSKKINQEMIFARKYLTRNNVDYEVFTSDKRSGFPKQLIKFASEINADLIAIVNETGINALPTFFSEEEHHIMDNKPQIPVLVMNATEKFVASSSLFVNKF